MKNYIVSIVLLASFVFMCITNHTYVLAHEDVMYYNTGEVTRGECIMRIMKTLGVDDVSANAYADFDYVDPMFYDFEDGDIYTGYIIIAYLSDVAVGVTEDYFEPHRNVTLKECLAFALRCLNEPDSIKWDNSIIGSSVGMGLLTEKEAEMILPDSELARDVFETVMERMSKMEVRLYWERPKNEYGHMSYKTSDNIL